jgi:hypothetical protein
MAMPPASPSDGSSMTPGSEGYYSGGQRMVVVGDRTFVLRDGTTWIDTTYDSSRMSLIAIPFLSDEYFALLDQHPEIGPYLALGDHVIVVIAGQAYEIKP